MSETLFRCGPGPPCCCSTPRRLTFPKQRGRGPRHAIERLYGNKDGLSRAEEVGWADLLWIGLFEGDCYLKWCLKTGSTEF